MSSNLQTLAIIPGRGGSKGIPGKNIRLLAGKPLIVHTISAAFQAQSVTRIMVSTDHPEIAAVARNAGAEISHRPAEISGDNASSEAALLDVLYQLEKSENYRPDITVFLQCTSPLTTHEDIDGTVAALLSESADSAFSAVQFNHFLWRVASGGGVEGINHDKRFRPLRQNREPQFLENGGVYVFRTESFLQSKHRFCGKTAMYLTSPERCLEIDEPYDFELAEIALARRPFRSASR